ncbi:MAG TPA: nuclear transport factor 2 family protein, partial [Burkholderiaceae bacterium]|nr:nuclear transport factor 2 family protein [Burkholderiaceae bacterium]
MTRDQYADRLQVLVAFFETLTLAHVAVLRELYAPDAYFKDPFNEVHSVTDIERIFTHMFQQVQAPRFVVSDAVQQGDQAFLVWTF